MQTEGTAETLPKSKWTLFNAPTVVFHHRSAFGGRRDQKRPREADAEENIRRSKVNGGRRNIDGRGWGGNTQG